MKQKQSSSGGFFAANLKKKIEWLWFKLLWHTRSVHLNIPPKHHTSTDALYFLIQNRAFISLPPASPRPKVSEMCRSKRKILFLRGSLSHWTQITAGVCATYCSCLLHILLWVPGNEKLTPQSLQTLLRIMPKTPYSCIHSHLLVLEARSLRSECWQGHSLWRLKGRVLPLPVSGGGGHPWNSSPCSYSTPISASISSWCSSLYVSLLFSYGYWSDWIRPIPLQ